MPTQTMATGISDVDVDAASVVAFTSAIVYLGVLKALLSDCREDWLKECETTISEEDKAVECLDRISLAGRARDRG